MSADNELGLRLHTHLVSVGLETPIKNSWSDKDRVKMMRDLEKLYRKEYEIFGLDLDDDSLSETPKRRAKMMVNELFGGLNYNAFPKCTVVQNKMCRNDNFVMLHDIVARSMCEHHQLGIEGRAFVAYVPGENALGLSKMARLVDFFGSRPQVQERWTEQIAEAISFVTGSNDVAVLIDAEHDCMKVRGIEDPCSGTLTLATRGIFNDTQATVRREFLDNVRAYLGKTTI